MISKMLQPEDVAAWANHLADLFERRRGRWFLHPRRLSDQDVYLVSVEATEEWLDVVLGDRLVDAAFRVRLRIPKLSIQRTPERFMPDNYFVELMEFIESSSSPGLPDPAGNELVIEYS